MAKVVDAIYENGVIKPLVKLDLPESQPLRITIEETGQAGQGASDRERALTILRGAGLLQWTREECERVFGSLPVSIIDRTRADQAFKKLSGKLSEEIIHDRGNY